MHREIFSTASWREEDGVAGREKSHVHLLSLDIL
jgi:hypothetical protein